MTTDPAVGEVAVGVDLGGTNVRAARITRDGRILARERSRSEGASDIVGLIADLCAGLLDDTVRGIGIGVPGRLDAEREMVLSAGFVELSGVRLGDAIRERIGRPAVLENDAHMALLAELELGAAAGARDVVLFTVGTGIGGAVAQDHEIAHGRANAGQLGHLAIDPEGPPCRCGRRGCSETVASGTALAASVRAAGLSPDTTAEQLLGLATRKPADPTAEAVLRHWARAWRDTIDSVVAVVDPELVVLGGGLGEVAAGALAAFAPPVSSWFDRPVVPAALGDEAGVVGAGLRVLR